MNQFRVLIIVLASDTDPVYCRFQDAWRLTSHPRADILFLKAHPDIQGDDFISSDTIFIRCRESLDTVYEKQMRGFRVLRPRLNDYAFVFRTNLSSYVDIPKYLAFCDTLPKTNIYSGVIGNHNGVSFASGSGFTITPDLIYRLIDENPPEIFWDDVSIGGAIAKWGVPILPAPRMDWLTDTWLYSASVPPDNIFHRRIKSDNREYDAQLLTRLFKNGQSVVVDKSLSEYPFGVSS
jgi:hypothetical protein